MSYTFTVNGVQRTTDEKKSLLRYLRDDLRLTSVKDGCSQGACGACTVIIDGETVKSCVPTTDRLEGKNIVTVEGLTEWDFDHSTNAGWLELGNGMVRVRLGDTVAEYNVADANCGLYEPLRQIILAVENDYAYLIK